MLCFAREQKDFQVIENAKEVNFINSVEDQKKSFENYFEDAPKKSILGMLLKTLESL